MPTATAPRKAAPATAAQADVHTKLMALRSELAAKLIEREQEINLTLTALVAGEHVLLVGDPGLGKSLLFDAFVRGVDGESFSVLLTKFTTPEEVMGPLSITALKQDRYLRVTDHRLPTASVAFLDEIFKASSAILNTLLRMLNECVYENDGQWVKTPLELCVAASNEWPTSENGGAELAALFDRFALRREVRPIRSARGRDRLLFDADLTPNVTVQVTPAEIAQARAEAAALPFSDPAKAALVEILRRLAEEGVLVSDRRQRKAVKVARAFAWICGSATVETDHLEILDAVLWSDPIEQPKKAREIIGAVANPLGMKVNAILCEIEEIAATTDPKQLAQAATACTKLGEIANTLKGLGSDPRVLDALDHARAMAKDIKIRGFADI